MAELLVKGFEPTRVAAGTKWADRTGHSELAIKEPAGQRQFFGGFIMRRTNPTPARVVGLPVLACRVRRAHCTVRAPRRGIPCGRRGDPGAPPVQEGWGAPSARSRPLLATTPATRFLSR